MPIFILCAVLLTVYDSHLIYDYEQGREGCPRKMNEMSAVIRQISMERANERDRNGFYLRMTPEFVAEEEERTAPRLHAMIHPSPCSMNIKVVCRNGCLIKRWVAFLKFPPVLL